MFHNFQIIVFYLFTFVQSLNIFVVNAFLAFFLSLHTRALILYVSARHCIYIYIYTHGVVTENETVPGDEKSLADARASNRCAHSAKVGIHRNDLFFCTGCVCV